MNATTEIETASTEPRPTGLTASYSPEDNKLRLYSLHRLDSETYARMRAAGFIFAPKQDLFVAPMWTPEREDILLELCGEIGDEDTSLVDRAEQRAERFEEYSEKRAADSASARASVDRIADGIPLGQPILVGHHSERRARKDAERIRSGMEKSVRMWDTSVYWTRRAAGAVASAKYKERPDVRQRRIKGLESDMRRQVKRRADSMAMAKAWGAEGLTLDRARQIANYDSGAGVNSWRRVVDVLEGRSDEAPEAVLDAVRSESVAAHTRMIERCERWIGHLTNRLAYERAMLGDIPEAPKPTRRALPPMANFPGEGYAHMTKAEWAAIFHDYRGSRIVRGARVRTCMVNAMHGVKTPQPDGKPLTGHGLVGVYIVDSKRTDPPAAAGEAGDAPPRFKPVPGPGERAPYVGYVAPAVPREDPVADLRAGLKGGVQVVSAPQLFPTPPELAARMVSLAGIRDGVRVLEPSAGTGRLLAALRETGHTMHIVAIEVAQSLSSALRRGFQEVRTDIPQEVEVIGSDFLEMSPDRIGRFDAIVMNPPFTGGADIAHIEHALTFLETGGRLVALCANGPRQREKLKPMVDGLGGTWEDLPEGSFASEGTGVRVALVTVRAVG